MNSLTDPGAARPPFDPSLVAELHAGALEPGRAERLLPAVLADPDAAALYRSLDDVGDRLAELADPPRDRDTAGVGAAGPGDEPGPIPDILAARIRRSLIAQPHPSDTDVGPHHPPRTGARKLRPLRRGLIAAAAIAAGLAIALPAVRAVTDGPVDTDVADGPASVTSGQGSSDDAASTARRAPLTDDEILGLGGIGDPGPYSDPERLARCLDANGLPPASPLLGSGPVRIDGRNATLLLVPGAHPPQLTGLVVTDTCGDDGTGLLYRTDVDGESGP